MDRNLYSVNAVGPITDAELIASRLSAGRGASIPCLSLVEQGAPTRVGARDASILRGQTPDSLLRFDLQCEIRWADAAYEVFVRAGSRIGTGRFVFGNDALDLVIEPKIGNANFFRMLEVCYGGLATSNDPGRAFRVDSPPAGLLIEYTVGRIEAFLKTQLFRGYSLKYEPEARHPKGHFDVGRFVTRNLPRLRLDVLSCSFFEFSQNVLENQILARTLLVAGRVAAYLPSEIRYRIANTIAAAKRFLPSVDAPHIDPEDLNRVLYTNRNKGFQPVHELCALLLSNASVSLSPGRRISFMSFSLAMDLLFERFVYRLFAMAIAPQTVIPKARLKFVIHGIGKDVELDGLIRNDRTTVVECKYKLIESGEALDFDEGRMRNADIFQCIAYATHTDVNADDVFLVYPSADADGPPVRVATTIRSFQRRNGAIIPVKVLLVSLARPTIEVEEALRSVVSSPANASA